MAREWFQLTKGKWDAEYAKLVMHRLERDMFPSLAKRPINEIAAVELLAALRKIEKRGAVDTARRSLQKCGQICLYAVVTGRADRDPTTDLRVALKPAPKQHYASIKEPKEVGALVCVIRDYQGAFETKTEQSMRISEERCFRRGRIWWMVGSKRGLAQHLIPAGGKLLRWPEVAILMRRDVAFNASA